MELLPAGDVDCYRFSTEGGDLVAETGNVAGTCGGNDTKLWLYEDGVTDINDEIEQNDDSAGNLCSLIERTVDAGTYVLCVEYWSRISMSEVTGALLSVSVN